MCDKGWKNIWRRHKPLTCYLCIKYIYLYVIYRIISTLNSRLIEETSPFIQKKSKSFFRVLNFMEHNKGCNIILFSNVSLHSIIVSYQDAETKLIYDTAFKIIYLNTPNTQKRSLYLWGLWIKNYYFQIIFRMINEFTCFYH